MDIIRFKLNQKLRVKDSSAYHPGRIGFFQFLGGPEKDAIVLSDEPSAGETGYTTGTYFAVGIEDVEFL